MTYKKTNREYKLLMELSHQGIWELSQAKNLPESDVFSLDNISIKYPADLAGVNSFSLGTLD